MIRGLLMFRGAPEYQRAPVDKNRIWDLLGLVEPHPVRVDPHDEHSCDDPSHVPHSDGHRPARRFAPYRPSRSSPHDSRAPGS